MDRPAHHANDDVERRILAAFAAVRDRLHNQHAPAFLEIDITMPQAKVLYLVTQAGGTHMSELAGRLGVSLSTVSGLVDRLVDHGLVSRREDPSDRRLVVVEATPAALALEERFQEFNANLLRRLLDGLAPDERLEVARAFDLLARAAERLGEPLPAQMTERTTRS